MDERGEMEVRTTGNASLANGSAVMSFAGTDLLQRYKPLFLLLYCALVAVACVGNAFLLGCIVGDKRLHNATNFFIGNLSAADLLMCLSCVPLTLSYAFEPRGWLFGGFMCHFVTLLQSATVYVTVLSLTAIAVDRYVVVVHPIRRRTDHRWLGLTTASIWLASLSLASPAAIHTHHQRLDMLDFTACGEIWPAMETQRIAYSCTIVLLSYILPLTATTVSYCAISARLKKRHVLGLGDAVGGEARWGKGKRRTFLLLVLSVLVFAISWLPLQLLNLLIDLDTELTLLNYSHVKLLHLTCHWVAMSSSCYNPFIYASLHRKLRLRLHEYVQRRRRNIMVLAGPNSS